MSGPDVHQTPRIVIYGDFNCPFSALASVQARRLERRGNVRIDWCAVDHDPSIPSSGAAITGALQSDGERELDQVRDLLADDEAERLRRPPLRPNTWLVTGAYAACPEQSRPLLRETLFAMCWHHGEDLGDPQVVRRLCGERADHETASGWREEWTGLPESVVPTMVLPDGSVSVGLNVLGCLIELIEAPRDIRAS